MKQHTSRVFRILTLLYLTYPIAYILFAAVLFDIPPSRCVGILLSPTYVIISALAMLAGYGLQEMKRWAWYVFVVANGFTFWGNAYLVTNNGETQYKIISFVIATGAVAFAFLRIAREVRVPYFLPSIRWWETNPRYKLNVPVRIARSDGTALKGEILDLSPAGCFAKLQAEATDEEDVTLSFKLYGQDLEIRGTVVWRAASAVTHPKGIGVKFKPLRKSQRRAMKAMMQHLKRIRALYRSSRYLMGQDDFIRRLDELESYKLVLPQKLREDT